MTTSGATSHSGRILAVLTKPTALQGGGGGGGGGLIPVVIIAAV